MPGENEQGGNGSLSCRICNIERFRSQSTFNNHIKTRPHNMKYLRLQSILGFEKFYVEYGVIPFGGGEDESCPDESVDILNHIELMIYRSGILNKMECRVCDIKCGSMTVWKQHIHGRKHIKKCADATRKLGREKYLNLFGDIPIPDQEKFEAILESLETPPKPGKPIPTISKSKTQQQPIGSEKEGITRTWKASQDWTKATTVRTDKGASNLVIPENIGELPMRPKRTSKDVIMVPLHELEMARAKAQAQGLLPQTQHMPIQEQIEALQATVPHTINVRPTENLAELHSQLQKQLLGAEIVPVSKREDDRGYQDSSLNRVSSRQRSEYERIKYGSSSHPIAIDEADHPEEQSRYRRTSHSPRRESRDHRSPRQDYNSPRRYDLKPAASSVEKQYDIRKDSHSQREHSRRSPSPSSRSKYNKHSSGYLDDNKHYRKEDDKSIEARRHPRGERSERSEEESSRSYVAIKEGRNYGSRPIQADEKYNLRDDTRRASPSGRKDYGDKHFETRDKASAQLHHEDQLRGHDRERKDARVIKIQPAEYRHERRDSRPTGITSDDRMLKRSPQRDNRSDSRSTEEYKKREIRLQVRRRSGSPKREPHSSQDRRHERSTERSRERHETRLDTREKIGHRDHRARSKEDVHIKHKTNISPSRHHPAREHRGFTSEVSVDRRHTSLEKSPTDYPKHKHSSQSEPNQDNYGIKDMDRHRRRSQSSERSRPRDLRELIQESRKGDHGIANDLRIKLSHKRHGEREVESTAPRSDYDQRLENDEQLVVEVGGEDAVDTDYRKVFVPQEGGADEDLRLHIERRNRSLHDDFRDRDDRYEPWPENTHTLNESLEDEDWRVHMERQKQTYGEEEHLDMRHRRFHDDGGRHHHEFDRDDRRRGDYGHREGYTGSGFEEGNEGGGRGRVLVRDEYRETSYRSSHHRDQDERRSPYRRHTQGGEEDLDNATRILTEGFMDIESPEEGGQALKGAIELFSDTLQQFIAMLHGSGGDKSEHSRDPLENMNEEEIESVRQVQEMTGIEDVSIAANAMRVFSTMDPMLIQTIGQLGPDTIQELMNGNTRALENLPNYNDIVTGISDGRINPHKMQDTMEKYGFHRRGGRVSRGGRGGREGGPERSWRGGRDGGREGINKRSYSYRSRGASTSKRGRY